MQKLHTVQSLYQDLQLAHSQLNQQYVNQKSCSNQLKLNCQSSDKYFNCIEPNLGTCI